MATDTPAQQDEQALRQLVATWMSATEAGDTDTVLGLMTDDALFLVPGQPVMDKAAFEAVMRQREGSAGPAVRGASDIKEIRVAGDWAFMWSHLTVEVTPAAPQPSITRAGHTMTVFQRQQGLWLLARDANLLVTVKLGS